MLTSLIVAVDPIDVLRLRRHGVTLDGKNAQQPQRHDQQCGVSRPLGGPVELWPLQPIVKRILQTSPGNVVFTAPVAALAGFQSSDCNACAELGNSDRP